MDSDAAATEFGVECARETYTCAPWYLRQHVSGFAHGARDLQQDVSVLVAAVLFLWIGGDVLFVFADVSPRLLVDSLSLSLQ